MSSSNVPGMDAPDRRHPRTATEAVQHTYYGQPVVKAPHWRWLIVVYFFLGGIAAGTSIIATAADLAGGDRRLVRAGRYLSFLALLPCPPLLILDLGRPERFLHMLRILKLRSPMSVGSWAISGLGLFAGISAALQVAEDGLHAQIPGALHRLASLATLPFAVVVSGYTGTLLAATNIPVWASMFPFAGPTFVCSAFSTSFGALSAILGFGESERPETARRVARAEAVCLAAELTMLTGGLTRAGALRQPLTRGRLGRIFWPVTYFGGIAVPLAVQLSGPAWGRGGSRPRRTVTALMVLTGGFALRALMIFAGRESARRPEDYFTLTERR